MKKEKCTKSVALQMIMVFQTYYQVSELKIYADKLGNGVNIYKIAKNNSQTYTDKEFKKIAKKNNW